VFAPSSANQKPTTTTTAEQDAENAIKKLKLNK
jgi:hypothetical protein